jgi:hypothetical protein
MIDDLEINFVCSREIVKDNFFEPLVEGLGDGKLVIFEQFDFKVNPSQPRFNF